MKRKFVIKGHYFQTKNEKYYTIERKNFGIFCSDYAVPLFYDDEVNNDNIITYEKYKFSNPDKAIEVLQRLEKFYALNVPEIEIAWDFAKDTYVYIPKNNLRSALGYFELINKDLVFTEPVDALAEYYAIEERKKSWTEKTVVLENGKLIK